MMGVLLDKIIELGIDAGFLAVILCNGNGFKVSVPTLDSFVSDQHILQPLLDKELKENSEEDSGLTMCSLEAFENIAYLMAKHADPSIPDSAEEWLEGFSVFSIYQVLPEIISLWGVNLETQSVAKKTACHRAAVDDASLSAPLCASWDLHPGSRPAHSGAR